MRARLMVHAMLVVCAVAGCVRTATSTCSDGTVCPNRTVCILLHEGNGDRHRCVLPEQVGCTGAETHESCSQGACYPSDSGGVCLPAGCANDLVDDNEQCDDGNNVAGDGCSADCASDESCANGIVDPIRSEDCDDQNLLSHDGCSSRCETETRRWALASWNLGAHAAMAMAYDVARRRAVAFGGAKFIDDDPFHSDGVRDDTFEWDGTTWVRRSPGVGPAPRFGHAMVYDAERRRVVLFGGREVDDLNDTWEWDGDSWQSIATPPPPRRSFHAMAYDAKRKRVVLFGGRVDELELDDTWEFDGAVWTQVVGSSGPTARSGHVMAFDPVRAVVVMAGGTQANDTWEYDGVWKMTPAQFPVAFSAAAFDPATSSVVALGGRTHGAGVSNELRSYDGQQWSVIAAQTPPTARELHSLVGDPIARGLLVSPGVNFDVAPFAQAGTARWNGTAWQVMPDQLPPPGRVSTAIAFDPVRRRTLLFGGYSGISSNLNDTWLLEHESWRELPMDPSGPTPRSGHAMTYDSAHEQAVMFGGYDGTSSLDETWLWNGQWSRAMPGTVPPARSGVQAVFDSARSRVVLYGGNAGAQVLADTWEWDGTTWHLVADPSSQPGPPPLSFVALGFDPIRRRTVLFGGSGAIINRDTWEWDGASWTKRVTSVSPSAVTDATLAWDAARRTLVLHGGHGLSGHAVDRLWEWDGEQWRELQLENTPMRSGHDAFSHPSGNGIAVISNQAVADLELWQLTSSSPTAAHEGCADASDLDGDGLRGCGDPDCWVTCAPLCPPGVTCAPTAPQCGDGTCNTALENCRLCPDDCGSCTPVCGDFVCDPNESCLGDC